MDTLEEFYNTNTKTLANASDFFPQEPVNEFPYEGVNVGTLESLRNKLVPALLSFESMNGLCFLTRNSNRIQCLSMLQSIVLRLIASLPKGACHFTLYDPLGLGSNLITLSGLNKEITGGQIISGSGDFYEHLLRLQNHIPSVIQNVLGYKFMDNTLIEYNKNNSDNFCPYEFIVLTDFPSGLKEDHLKLLDFILQHGQKAGTYVLLTYNTEVDNANSYMEILKKLPVIYEKDSSFFIKNYQYQDAFKLYKWKLENAFMKNVDDVLFFINEKYSRAKDRYSNSDLKHFLPQSEKRWTCSSAESMRIPFGITPERKVVDLNITQMSGQNVVVVVGIPGSGKSVFLNTLIISAAYNYSPDELEMYLIDFSGVEFSAYADYSLPHAKIVAPESEREFGISVLQKIKAEALRRMDLFREAGVNNIAAYRSKKTDEKLPRILLIIDEFQKFFDNDMDAIAMEAEKSIKQIVQEYRKFGINLVLATQSIRKYAEKIELGMIANRVAFEWKDDDSTYLFSDKAPLNMVNEPGECVYNCKSGRSKDNVQNKAFFVSQDQMKNLLSDLNIYAKKKHKEIHDQLVFRSDSLAYFNKNKVLQSIKKEDMPITVDIFLGEPISVSSKHVSIELKSNTNANVLIIGGQDNDAGLRIAINCMKSCIAAHKDKMAYFAIFNFMQQDNPLYDAPKRLFGNIPFDVKFLEGKDQLQYLENIKFEIERRQQDPKVKRRHVYLSFYALQYAYEYRTTGEWGDMSEHGKLLSFILEQGPLVGIFTFLQVDELSSLSKTMSKPISLFNNRVVLQMSEDDSRNLTESSIASRIFVVNKKSSMNRAYFYNKNNNTITKFRPYEI